MNDLVKFLKCARESKGMTQKDMSEAMNVSQSCISKYESGKLKVDIETFVKWSNVTGTEMQAIMILYGTETLSNISVIASNFTLFMSFVMLI